MRHRRLCLVLATSSAVAAALALAAPAGAQRPRECFLLSNCTSVVGPWVVIPAANPIPIPAGVTVSCPDSGGELQLAVGSDYELAAGATPPPDVTRFMAGPGAGLLTGGSAPFFAVSFSRNATSFRPHVGCTSRDSVPAAPVQAEPVHVLRTRELSLRPSRTVQRSHRCRSGERLVRGVAGVLFHREAPPTARELRDVTVSHRTGRRRVRATVETGRRVGDHERVTLQILAVCAR